MKNSPERNYSEVSPEGKKGGGALKKIGLLVSLAAAGVLAEGNMNKAKADEPMLASGRPDIKCSIPQVTAKSFADFGLPENLKDTRAMRNINRTALMNAKFAIQRKKAALDKQIRADIGHGFRLMPGYRNHPAYAAYDKYEDMVEEVEGAIRAEDTGNDKGDAGGAGPAGGGGPSGGGNGKGI